MVRFQDNLIFKDTERQEFDYRWLASRLKSLGYQAPTKKIHDLARAGILLGIKKGFYVLSGDYARGPVCKETLANLIYGPSCISLEYALAFHRLIPERVETVTSVTPKKDKRFETPLGLFTYRYLALEKYREGVDLIWIDSKHPVLMASPEKALADYVVLNRVSGISEAEEVSRFLFEDLRIDPQRFQRLNARAFRKLTDVYRSKPLKKILSLLREDRS